MVVHEPVEPDESVAHCTLVMVAVSALHSLVDEGVVEGVFDGFSGTGSGPPGPSVGVPDGFSGTGSGTGVGLAAGFVGFASGAAGGPTYGGGGPGGTWAFGSIGEYGGGGPGGHGLIVIPRNLTHSRGSERPGIFGSEPFGRFNCNPLTWGILKSLMIIIGGKIPPGGGPGGPGGFGRPPMGIGIGMKNGRTV
jgi:hypothetical protein